MKNKFNLQHMETMLFFAIIIFLPAIILLYASGRAVADSPEEKGLAIAVEADRRDTGYKDSTANMLMILKNRHGQESRREIRIRSLEVHNDGDKSLTIFDSPKDVKGTAFLNFTHKVGDDDQWLYLPALKRVKRISSRNKSGSFMGSEFSYEDIASQEIEKYTYKWVRDEDHEERNYFVIERYPVDKKVQYYDRKNAHLKTLTMSNYQQYKEKFWRAAQLDMINHQTGKSTELQFSNYIFDVGLDDDDFNKNSLKRAK
jgi:outer membrane lipoprotein-sorting protein